MNPITKALEDIRRVIPIEILRATFVNENVQDCEHLISLDTRIREDVLDSRVFVDIDIHGGSEAYIVLDHPVTTQIQDPYTVVYHIPPEVTQNRPITQVYSIHFGVLGYQQAGLILGYPDSALSSANRQLLDAVMRTPPAMTSYLNLINHNTVMARFIHLPHRMAFMRLRLGNDNALSHIRYQTIPDFSHLCQLAVKAHIYNTMMIRINEAWLSGGRELGVFNQIVSGYADAEEEYKNALIRFKKISIFNDSEANRRHLRTIVGMP